MTLITIFGPIFFFTHGYSLEFISLLLGLQCIANATSRPLTARLMHNHSPGKLLAISIVGLALTYLLIGNYYQHTLALASLFMLAGALDGAQWSLYQYIFTKVRIPRHLGSQVGITTNISITVAALGLVVGGFVAGHYSVAWNYGLAAVAMGTSAICIIAIKVNNVIERQRYDLSRKDIMALRKDWLSGVGNLNDWLVVEYVWPFMLVAVLAKSIELTGYSLALATITMIAVVALVGRFSDKNRAAGKLFNLGIYVGMVMQLLRIVGVWASPIAAAVTLSGSSVRTTYDIPYNVFYYERMESFGRLRYLTVYETLNNFALAAVWFLLAGLIVLLGTKSAFIFIIIITAVSMPLMRLIPRKTAI